MNSHPSGTFPLSDYPFRIDNPTESAIADASAPRRYFAELLVVFVGVALAFAVENFREDLNERVTGDQYLGGFRDDLAADLETLRAQNEARLSQLENAKIILNLIEHRVVDPQAFFERYYPILLSLNTRPNRNTMDEVLSSGSPRLIRDHLIRTALLNLYSTYDRIALLEKHIERDFDTYLYDPTFTSIPFRVEGPWADTRENRRYVEVLLNDVRVENGLQLVVANLQFAHSGGLLGELEKARSQVERLLELVPTE
jgi:hypothetical protein